ncbi:MAG: phosphotransferase [Clostridia bacterium]
MECLNYKPFNEPEILSFLGEVGFPAPRIIEVRNNCIVLSYIDGVELGKMLNWSDDIPLEIVASFAKEIYAVNSINYDELLALYKKAVPNNSFDFYINYYSFNKQLLAKHWNEIEDTIKQYLPLFDDVLINRSKEMIAEELAFCHGDIHQENIILQNGNATLIDWESACIAPISYEIAMHLRKLGTQKNIKMILLNNIYC